MQSSVQNHWREFLTAAAQMKMGAEVDDQVATPTEMSTSNEFF